MSGLGSEPVAARGQRPRLNPCELEIDLFCQGLRLESSAMSPPHLQRTRAGLGSGLELVIAGTFKDIWVNVPVEETFAAQSCYVLREEQSSTYVEDEVAGHRYPVRLAPQPHWYGLKTSQGVPMSRVGTLQGTYLGIYIGPVCRFWSGEVSEQCAFCTTGLNVGSSEVLRKTVADVVETCLAAQAESGVTFVHLNSGYQAGKDLAITRPFVVAVKKATGLLIGLQMAPVRDLGQYDELIDLGVNHFSFCFEFMNDAYFRFFCPGKQRALGQSSFFRALEYTAGKLGKGRVSGEIIAGVEPLEDTLKAIDFITDCGAFPTVCIFRPLRGSRMESWPPPSYQEMREVFQHLIESCMAKHIPIGIAPNIEVSLVVQPTDALYLASRTLSYYRYRLYNRLLSAFLSRLFTMGSTRAGRTHPPSGVGSIPHP